MSCAIFSTGTSFGDTQPIQRKQELPPAILKWQQAPRSPWTLIGMNGEADLNPVMHRAHSARSPADRSTPWLIITLIIDHLQVPVLCTAHPHHLREGKLKAPEPKPRYHGVRTLCTKVQQGKAGLGHQRDQEVLWVGKEFGRCGSGGWDIQVPPLWKVL